MIKITIVEINRQTNFVAVFEAESQHFTVGESDLTQSCFSQPDHTKVAVLKFTINKYYISETGV